VDKFLNNKYIDDVVVVVGHEKCRVIDAVSDNRVKFVYNTEYVEGMSTSVKVGVSAVIKYSDIILIHPGDVFFTRPETLNLLIEKAIALRREGKEFILIPRYGSKGGHPLIVTKELAENIKFISEEEKGLKGFLNRYRDKVIYVNVDDVGVLADVDTLEDLKRNLKLLQ
jgi:molybdenum cofactor cytidylyltransferase